MGLRFSVLLVAGLLLTVAGAPAWAQAPLQPKSQPQLDVSKSANRFSPDKQASTFKEIKAPDMNAGLQGKDFSGATKSWSGKQSNLVEKKANFDVSQNKQYKRIEQKFTNYAQRNYDSKDFRDARKMDPRYDKATQRDNFYAAKYRDAWTARLGPTGKEMIDYSKKLSMQDVNRFQFRKSHSSEKGLPVRVAGSEGPVGQGRSAERMIQTGYDSSPRSTGVIREAPKPTALMDASSEGDRQLTSGGRGLTKPGNAATSAPPAGRITSDTQMIPKSQMPDLNKPAQSKWSASSRVVD